MKKFLKKIIPTAILNGYRAWRYRRSINRRKFEGKTPEQIFNEIFDEKYWRGGGSRSGPGSELEQTQALREALPLIFKKYETRSLLDLPCGDFNWMQHVDLQGIRYIGADIVEKLVLKNQTDFDSPERQFLHLDLLESPLPTADLVLVRDCLVHFSFAHVFQAIENLKRSGSRFLLTTSFSGDRKNENIQTGGWRPLNLQKPPFNFPPPLEIVDEKCTEVEGAYRDKCLMLWRLSEL